MNQRPSLEKPLIIHQNSHSNMKKHKGANVQVGGQIGSMGIKQTSLVASVEGKEKKDEKTSHLRKE